MPGNRKDAIRRLVTLLRRYFRPSGIPPRMPCWEFPVAVARPTGIDFSARFGDLLSDVSANPIVEEFLSNVPALREVAEALRVADSFSRRLPRNDKASILFEGLLKASWCGELSSNVRCYAVSQDKIYYFGFGALEIDETILTALEEAFNDLGDNLPQEIIPSVQLGSVGDPVFVNGIEKRPLTKVRYLVLSTLLSVFPKRLTKGQLESKTGKGDAVSCLRDLRKSDPDWKEALLFPEKQYGSGYGIAPRK